MARAMDNSILETIVQQVRPLIGQGKVADYIPAARALFYSVNFKGAQSGRGDASLSGR